MKLILFEWKKLMGLKVFSVFLLAASLFICGLFVRNLAQQDAIPAGKMDYYSKVMGQLAGQLELDRKAFEVTQDEAVQERIKLGSALYQNINDLFQDVEKGNWKGELKGEIKMHEMAIQYRDLKGDFPGNIYDMKQEIKLNKELLALGLPKEDQDLSIQVSVFMKKTLSLFLQAPVYIILLFVLAMLVTKEYDDQSIKLVRTQPVSPICYMAVKFAAISLAGLIWLGSVLALSWILPVLFGRSGAGSFTYPLILDSGEFISAAQYLKMACIYGISFIIFSAAAVVLLGGTIKNSMVTILIIGLAWIGGMLTVKNGMDAMGNPFMYQDADRAVLALGNALPGSFVLLAFTAGIMCISFILYRRGTAG